MPGLLRFPRLLRVRLPTLGHGEGVLRLNATVPQQQVHQLTGGQVAQTQGHESRSCRGGRSYRSRRSEPKADYWIPQAAARLPGGDPACDPGLVGRLGSNVPLESQVMSDCKT
jgi:hypothetical protein